MVARNINTNFYQSVRLKMNWNDRNKIKIFHRGLDLNIYDPVMDGKNLLEIPGYNTNKIDFVDITLTSKSRNPNPLWERDAHDINEELARIDSKWRIMQDHLRPSDNKSLIHNHQPKETLTRHGLATTHPYLSGENDALVDKLEDVHDVQIPIRELREEEKNFEKRKVLYHKTKLNYVRTLNQQTGEPMATVKMGYLP